MNLRQEEAWDRMLKLLVEAQKQDELIRGNTLLEAIVYGIGIIICREERDGKKRQSERLHERQNTV
jgi:hypothetical protein